MCAGPAVKAAPCASAKSSALDQLLQRQRQGRFEPKNTERRAIELYIFERRLVRSVIVANGSTVPSGPSEQRFAVFPAPAAIHLNFGIALTHFDHREVMRRDFRK